MRTFELIDQSSHKFWEIQVEGNTHTVRYGKIGTDGRTQTKEFASAEEARVSADKLIRQKTKKGYAEVGAAPSGEGSPSDPAAAVEAEAAAVARVVPADGSWSTLVSPGGGRPYLGLPHARWCAAHGSFRLQCTEQGIIHRIDMAAATATHLATLPVGPQRYVSLAIDASGAHWAYTNDETTFLDGDPLELRLDTLTFTDDGQLLGFHGQEILRVDPGSREAVWRGGRRAEGLAGTKGWIVGAHFCGAELISPDGELHSIKTDELGTVRLVLAREGKAYCFCGDRGMEWILAIDVATQTHECFAQPLPFDIAVTSDGRIVWRNGEFDSSTGQYTKRPGAGSLDSKHMASFRGSPVPLTLSPDEKQIWELHGDSSAIRRLSLETREELGAEELRGEGFVWDLAVAPDGRVAVAHDELWRVLDPSGQELFRADGLGQVFSLAMSPTGDRVAVIELRGSGTFLRVVSCDRYETIVERKMDIGPGLCFSPDGERLLVVGDAPMLCSADRLETQHALGGGSSRGMHWSEGRIVAHDSEGRVYVFDDPGPGPAVKRPKKLKPSLKLPRAEAEFGGGMGQPHVEIVGERVAVLTGTELVDWDLATKKKIAGQPCARGYGTRVGGVYCRQEDDGVSLWRFGESEPFARLPHRPVLLDASADSHQVAASFHHGVLLWSGHGTKTVEAEQAQPTVLVGFVGDTLGLAVAGMVVELPMREARALAEAVAQQARARGLPNLVAVPVGDHSETTAFEADDAVFVIVGFEVARADAEAEQGTMGPTASVTKAAADKALEAWAELRAEAKAWLEGRSANIEVPAGLQLVATGPLASVHLEGVDDATLVLEGEVVKEAGASWEEAEQWLTIELRGDRFELGAAYD